MPLPELTIFSTVPDTTLLLCLPFFLVGGGNSTLPEMLSHVPTMSITGMTLPSRGLPGLSFSCFLLFVVVLKTCSSATLATQANSSLSSRSLRAVSAVCDAVLVRTAVRKIDASSLLRLPIMYGSGSVGLAILCPNSTFTLSPILLNSEPFYTLL